MHLLLGNLAVGLHGVRDDRSLDWIVSIGSNKSASRGQRTLLSSTQSCGIVLASNVVASVGVVVVEHCDGGCCWFSEQVVILLLR